MRIAAVIPAHNEAATIGDIASRARGCVPQVVVVDDGSNDDTAQRVQDLDVTLLRNEVNEGKAASLWRGMQWALDAGADAVVTLDGDGQHCPDDIPRLLTAAASQRSNCIIIGARLRGRANAPRLRRCANRFADFWISWAAGHRIADSQSGFRLYPAELLRRVALPHDREHGFVFESEILIEAAWLGLRSVSVEIDSVYAAARASHYRAVADTWRIVRMVAWKLLRRGLYPRGLLAVLTAHSRGRPLL